MRTVMMSGGWAWQAVEESDAGLLVMTCQSCGLTVVSSESYSLVDRRCPECARRWLDAGLRAVRRGSTSGVF